MVSQDVFLVVGSGYHQFIPAVQRGPIRSGKKPMTHYKFRKELVKKALSPRGPQLAGVLTEKEGDIKHR